MLVFTRSRRRFFPFALVPAALFAFLPLGASAQTDQVARAVGGAPVFSLELKATPLRQALQSLFTNAHAQFSLADDLPNPPVTLSIRDQPLDDALKLLLRQAGGDRRVTYTREAGVYLIKVVPPPAEPTVVQAIGLHNVRPADVLDRLQTAFPDILFMPDSRSPDLLFRAPESQIPQLREMVNLLDQVTRTVVLKAEVVFVSGNSDKGTPTTGKPAGAAPRSTLLSTILRTTVGQEATGEDTISGTPAQTAKLEWHATPSLLGNGDYELSTRWDVSLPLPAGKTGASGKGESLVRLEKRLSNVSRLHPGDTIVVGGVVLNQYGLKGEVLFFVTLTEAEK